MNRCSRFNWMKKSYSHTPSDSSREGNQFNVLWAVNFVIRNLFSNFLKMNVLLLHYNNLSEISYKNSSNKKVRLQFFFVFFKIECSSQVKERGFSLFHVINLIQCTFFLIHITRHHITIFLNKGEYIHFNLWGGIRSWKGSQHYWRKEN